MNDKQWRTLDFSLDRGFMKLLKNINLKNTIPIKPTVVSLI